MIDELPFGRHPLTPEFERRLGWFIEQNEGGARQPQVFVTLVEAQRHSNRSQWRLHLATESAFIHLQPSNRGAAVAYARTLAELVVSWQEVEDVEATLPA